ncbi:MAG: hypothetical protein D6696_13440 [Acidobacteria bacterium]|nr:MAG: hypothetical protein D6696_13440 [Acidobacteriota bacterium]
MKSELNVFLAGLWAGVKRVLNEDLFTIGGTQLDVSSILIFVLIVAGTWWISRLLERAIARVLRRGGLADEGSIAAVQRLLHYAVLVVGLSTGLATIGINLGALFAAGAVFAVAIGFAMQNIAQNFVSGVILLVERSIKPKDVIEIAGSLVRIEEMGIRSTIVRTLDDEEVIVPNSELAQTMIKNFTLHDSLYRLRVLVGVAYESDMRQVDRVLQDAADALPWRYRERRPRILLREFGDSSVVFEVSVWIDDPWSVNRLRSDLHHAIWWALKDAGITIAFPQVDVHFDASVIERLPRVAHA